MIVPVVPGCPGSSRLSQVHGDHIRLAPSIAIHLGPAVERTASTGACSSSAAIHFRAGPTQGRGEDSVSVPPSGSLLLVALLVGHLLLQLQVAGLEISYLLFKVVVVLHQLLLRLPLSIERVLGLLLL